MMHISLGNNTYRKPFLIWLGVMIVLVASMMVVGAITRLTGSGLSMIEWRLLYGILPPLQDAEWQRIFALYKNTSQYQLLNYTMDLAGFKGIFWWEYLHRLLGRLIGLIYAIPMFVFLRKAGPSRALRNHLLILLVLGVMQGIIGWWMVKSGFVGRTSVSHFRLAVHLGMAMGILVYLFYVFLSVVTKDAPARTRLPWAVSILPFYLFFVVISGALVAGTNAGVGYNTWPLMDGGLLPERYGVLAPWWVDALNNTASIQFHHRMAAYGAVIVGVLCAWQTRTYTARNVRLFRMKLEIMLFVQVTLGILAIMFVVPLTIAALHQFGAIMLLLTGFGLRFFCARA
ncbi:MAG: COX15/CtaA family protein [Pseudomonadota bacterium]